MLWFLSPNGLFLLSDTYPLFKTPRETNEMGPWVKALGTELSDLSGSHMMEGKN